MAVEVKMSQRQIIKLKLTHKELIELAFTKAQGIGTWKIVDQSVIATTDSGYDYRAVSLHGTGDVTISLTLEAPVIG